MPLGVSERTGETGEGSRYRQGGFLRLIPAIRSKYTTKPPLAWLGFLSMENVGQ
jgi:hypothetical protein